MHSRRAPTTCRCITCVLTTCMGVHFQRRSSLKSVHFQRKAKFLGVHFQRGKSSQLTAKCGKLRSRSLPRSSRSAFCSGSKTHKRRFKGAPSEARGIGAGEGDLTTKTGVFPSVSRNSWTLADSVRTSQPQPFSFVEVVHAGGLLKKGIIDALMIDRRRLRASIGLVVGQDVISPDWSQPTRIADLSVPNTL